MTPTSFNEANTFSDWADLLQKGVTAIATAGDNKYTNSKQYSYSSAAQAASNLMAVFPTICSSSISADTAYIISKAVERKAFVILQLALAAANITDMRDGIEYLRQFHQNLKTNSTMADYMMAVDKFADETGGKYSTERNEVHKFLNMESTGIVPLDNIKETSVNDFLIREIGFGGFEITGRVINKDSYEYPIRPMTEAGTNKPAAALRDQDVKKMNELVPMIMQVSFKNTQTGADVNFIVGIKSKCIKANSDEIIKKIYNNNQDGKGLVNFIRATTGEIKFVKDLLLGLDQNKQDVIAASKRGSNEEIWNTLKIRAQNAKMYLRQGAVNYASAITTVVISQEDADYMYKTMNIDINNPHTALQFMKAYNLLGFCIVDDTVEEAKFLWDDGDPRFESVSYTMLEREEKDQSYKKVVNLLAKMR